MKLSDARILVSFVIFACAGEHLLEGASIPGPAMAFLSSAEEKTENIHCIFRRYSYIPQNSSKHNGLHCVFSKLGDKMFMDYMTFSDEHSREGLFDVKKSGAITFAYDGVDSYRHDDVRRYEFSQEQHHREGLEVENFMMMSFDELKNRKIMGDGHPELMGGGSSIYSGVNSGIAGGPLQLDYFILTGNSFRFGTATWNDALREGRINLTVDEPTTGFIRIEGEYSGAPYVLRIDPKRGFSLSNFQIYYPKELYDGRLISEGSVLDYRSIDGIWYPVKGTFRQFAGSDQYEEWEIEVLDIQTEKPEYVTYGPGMVFPNLAQGPDNRTGERFRYYADGNEVRRKSGDPMTIDIEETAKAIAADTVAQAAASSIQSEPLVERAVSAFSGKVGSRDGANGLGAQGASRTNWRTVVFAIVAGCVIIAFLAVRFIFRGGDLG